MIKISLKSFKVLHIKFAYKKCSKFGFNLCYFSIFQSAISSKLSEIGNVVDMLNSIIGKDEDESKKKAKKSKKSDSDSSPERIKTELLESMKRKKKEAEEK